MTARRAKELTALQVESIGARADRVARPAMLRLENLDTDLPVAPAAIEATHSAMRDSAANSYLPFRGRLRLREALVRHVLRLSGVSYEPHEECLITAGGLNGITNVLLALIETGDRVLVTDPTYVGLRNRIALAGGIPEDLALTSIDGAWRLDLAALAAKKQRCRAALLMSPSMPSGAVFEADEWEAIAQFCDAHDAWLIYDAAMERLLYDGAPYVHPASIPSLRGRTITVGSASKELGMIGWRVGWVVGPQEIMRDLARVCLANVVAPVGIAGEAVCAALEATSHFDEALATLQVRRDVMVRELQSIAAVTPPSGGWSLLFDVSPWDVKSDAAAERLFAADIAVTPMRGWGSGGADRFVRFVFSNEPAARYIGLGKRVSAALGAR